MKWDYGEKSSSMTSFNPKSLNTENSPYNENVDFYSTLFASKQLNDSKYWLLTSYKEMFQQNGKQFNDYWLATRFIDPINGEMDPLDWGTDKNINMGLLKVLYTGIYGSSFTFIRFRIYSRSKS